MLFFKIKTFFIFLIVISGCGVSHSKFTKINDVENIVIETPITKFNLIFKKDLRRSFINKRSKTAKFILKTNISFSSSDSLSVSGLNVLKSTKATVTYSLIDLNSGKTIKSGSIVTFPALSASSSSLYSNDVSLEYIKERLCLSSSKKLYMHIKLTMQKLS